MPTRSRPIPFHQRNERVIDAVARLQTERQIPGGLLGQPIVAIGDCVVHYDRFEVAPGAEPVKVGEYEVQHDLFEEDRIYVTLNWDPPRRGVVLVDFDAMKSDELAQAFLYDEGQTEAELVAALEGVLAEYRPTLDYSQDAVLNARAAIERAKGGR